MVKYSCACSRASTLSIRFYRTHWFCHSVHAFFVRLSVAWRRTTLGSLERTEVKYLVYPHRFRPLTSGKLAAD